MKKRVLSVLIVVCMAVSILSISAFAANFTDTKGHWAETAIDQWSSAGVVNGVGDNQFNPNGSMTRAEAAQVFVNLLKLTGKADISNFVDVPADAWYADAISACVANDIMRGVDSSHMNPTVPITREEFFVMFARAMGIHQENTLKKNMTDAGDVASWARGYVYALINNGYVNGMTSTTIAPELEINRASVMALLGQAIVSYVTESGTVEVKESGIVLVLGDKVTVTGDADMTVVVAAEGAEVSLKGSTGDVAVIAIADDVSIINAPVGTTVTAAEGVTGTTANGTAVSSDTTIVIPGATTSGGGTPIVPDPVKPSKPSIVVGGTTYNWDEEEQEYVSADGKESITVDQLESGVIIVDGKEYYYDAEEKEFLTEDREEFAGSLEDILGGVDEIEGVN